MVLNTEDRAMLICVDKKIRAQELPNEDIAQTLIDRIQQFCNLLSSATTEQENQAAAQVVVAVIRAAKKYNLTICEILDAMPPVQVNGQLIALFEMKQVFDSGSVETVTHLLHRILEFLRVACIDDDLFTLVIPRILAHSDKIE